MSIKSRWAVYAGTLTRSAMRLRGGGSALPGLVVETLDPSFLQHALSDVKYGVVIVSGTNGKTTTTKMVVQLLRSRGISVFTNPSGSNFTRGVAASLLGSLDKGGKLNADIAVIELDEAHAVHFIKKVKPRYSLLLNVLRDQLDRFGEIDATARLLEQVAMATTRGVVLNREDSLVANIGTVLSSKVRTKYFGLDSQLRKLFPSDMDMRSKTHDSPKETATESNVIISKIEDKKVTFSIDGKKQTPIELAVDGIYNIQNASAALSMVQLVCEQEGLSQSGLLKELSLVRPAFGRGEAIRIDGKSLEIVLVKNPSGFRLALASYAKIPAETMIVINDNYADGRDMSWLWDVDFDSLGPIPIIVSGLRSYDMANRLRYDGLTVSGAEPDIGSSLAKFLSSTKGKNRRIYCTYTAMLQIRKILSKSYDLEPIE